MPETPFKSAATTHVGKVRAANEDAYVLRDDVGLWAVADGMGGHEAGEQASQAVARHLEGIAGAAGLQAMLDATADALREANAELIDLAQRLGTSAAPGSTVVVLLIRAHEAAVTWAGDSRIYRRRNGRAELITRDHSHVQELIDEEMISPEEAESHPMAHAITRAVGIDETLELESMRFDVRAGDRYLLCSDGLSRLLSLDEIQEMLGEENPEDAVDALLQAALDRGAPDNVTVVAVDCDG